MMRKLASGFSYVPNSVRFLGHMEGNTKRWTKNCICKVNEKIPVLFYSSDRSRLHAAVAKTPGPLVKGLISFVTETFDDNGLPHTLEHLTFMGSKKYPYKGILDLIANRCMASGTNATTYQDHTTYELTTVGSEGFLKVLPVYLDHLLSPALAEAQFITEVHHINGKGEDAGVVYSEMQDYESEMNAIVEWKRKELFYPEYSPYRVETGGRLAALRTTCNMEEIKKFHREFYHISNMYVIVCGSIDHNKLLKILSDTGSLTVEALPAALMKKITDETTADQKDSSKQRIPHMFTRPFQNEMIIFSKPSEAEILCPCEDEKLGMVEIAWDGPDDLRSLRCLEVLAHYLCDTPAAPLEKDFVQSKKQLASSVCFSVREQCVSEIIFYFYGVPVEELKNIKEILFEKTLPFTFVLGFDLTRMQNTITHLIERKLSEMETNCHDLIFELLCQHQIYGNKMKGLDERLDYIGELRRMLEYEKSYWIRLSEKYLSQKYVCVIGHPSRSEVTRIATTEKNRIEQQRKNLGEVGLQQCSEKLEKAKLEIMSSQPSRELLSELMVRDLEDFATFKVQTVNTCSDKIKSDLFLLPLPVFIHSADTHFVKFTLVWDTKEISEQHRMLLMLYFELLFQSPAVVDNKKLSYENIAKLYIRDLVSYKANIGVLHRFWRFCSISLKAPPDRYVTMLCWLKTFIVGTVFHEERIKVVLKRLIAAADELKRDGCEMRDALLETTIHHRKANEHIFGLVQLEEYHRGLLRLIEKTPKIVIKRLEELRQELLKVDANVHIVCNTDKIMPFLPMNMEWLYKNRSGSPENKCPEFRNCPKESLAPAGFGKQRAIVVAACESSFLKQSIVFENERESEEALSVLLFAHYLSQVEGPLYKAIRGTGLAYSVRIQVDFDHCLLSFSIYRSAQLQQAYEQAKIIVLSEMENIDRDEFEAAKRSLVSEIVQGEDTVVRAANRALLNQFRGLSSDFWRLYCRRIWDASVEDVLKLSRDYIRDLFDDSKCSRAIAIPLAKVKDIEKHFRGIEIIESADLHLATSKF